jgi:hypothetical protein
MRPVILDRKGIGNAAARECKPGLTAQKGVVLGPANSQGMLASFQKRGAKKPGDVPGRNRAVSDAAAFSVHLNKRLKPAETS